MFKDLVQGIFIMISIRLIMIIMKVIVKISYPLFECDIYDYNDDYTIIIMILILMTRDYYDGDSHIYTCL
jgi:hypothetical protein